MQNYLDDLRHVLLSLLVASMVSSAHAEEGIPAWAEESTTIYYKANSQGDAAALAAVYSPEAIIYVSPDDPGNFEGKSLKIEGLDAIVEFFREDFANTRYECEWELTRVMISENLAAVSGHDTCVEIDRISGDRKIVASGEWVSVYKKHVNGKWLIILEHY